MQVDAHVQATLPKCLLHVAMINHTACVSEQLAKQKCYVLFVHSSSIT